ncbi:hypothetical protein Pcinc_026467, partial [Petrolisthes cinctipes]
VLANTSTAPRPEFTLTGLEAGVKYALTIMGVNKKGQSQPVKLAIVTLKDVAEKHTSQDGSSVAFISLLGILLGILASFLLMTGVVVGLVKRRSQGKSSRSNEVMSMIYKSNKGSSSSSSSVTVREGQHNNLNHLLLHDHHHHHHHHNNHHLHKLHLQEDSTNPDVIPVNDDHQVQISPQQSMSKQHLLITRQPNHHQTSNTSTVEVRGVGVVGGSGGGEDIVSVVNRDIQQQSSPIQLYDPFFSTDKFGDGGGEDAASFYINPGSLLRQVPRKSLQECLSLVPAPLAASTPNGNSSNTPPTPLTTTSLYTDNLHFPNPSSNTLPTTSPSLYYTHNTDPPLPPTSSLYTYNPHLSTSSCSLSSPSSPSFYTTHKQPHLFTFNTVPVTTPSPNAHNPHFSTPSSTTPSLHTNHPHFSTSYTSTSTPSTHFTTFSNPPNKPPLLHPPPPSNSPLNNNNNNDLTFAPKGLLSTAFNPHHPPPQKTNITSDLRCQSIRPYPPTPQKTNITSDLPCQSIRPYPPTPQKANITSDLPCQSIRPYPPPTQKANITSDLPCQSIRPYPPYTLSLKSGIVSERIPPSLPLSLSPTYQIPTPTHEDTSSYQNIRDPTTYQDPPSYTILTPTIQDSPSYHIADPTLFENPSSYPLLSTATIDDTPPIKCPLPYYYSPEKTLPPPATTPTSTGPTHNTQRTPPPPPPPPGPTPLSVTTSHYTGPTHNTQGTPPPPPPPPPGPYPLSVTSSSHPSHAVLERGE